MHYLEAGVVEISPMIDSEAHAVGDVLFAPMSVMLSRGGAPMTYAAAVGKIHFCVKWDLASPPPFSILVFSEFPSSFGEGNESPGVSFDDMKKAMLKVTFAAADFDTVNEVSVSFKTVEYFKVPNTNALSLVGVIDAASSEDLSDKLHMRLFVT